MCIWQQCNKDPSAALGMTVLGERIGSQGWCATFLEDDILVSQLSPLGNAYKGSQSPVIPLISGEWIVSHVWHEILRLSPHLFWLGLFPHGAF